MESITVAGNLWKQAQDSCFICSQVAEQMRKHFGVMSDAQAAHARSRKSIDDLQAARDSARLQLAVSEMRLSLRQAEQRVNQTVTQLAEAVAQSKLFDVLNVCPEGD